MIALLLAMVAPAQLQSAEAIDAMRCAAATAMTGPYDSADDMMQLGAEVSFHVMRAARADRGGQDFLGRVRALQETLPSYRPETGAELAAECRERFPIARTAVPARLPGDPFDRDVLCLATLGLVVGLSQGQQEQYGDTSYLDRFKPVMNRFSSRVDDATLQKHGIASESDFTILAGDQLEASIAVGNPLSVATSCEVMSHQF